MKMILRWILGFVLATSNAWATSIEIQEISQELIQGALESPEVISAVQAVHALNDQPVDPRASRASGWDLRLGFPTGIGTSFHYSVAAPLTLRAAADTTGFTYSVSADATVNILPIFMEAHWTPVVTVGFSHIRFTGLAGQIIENQSPYLREQGILIDPNGTWMNSLYFMGGVDYSSPGGFHLNVSVGQLRQLGESQGGDPDSTVTLRNWVSPIVIGSMGYRW